MMVLKDKVKGLFFALLIAGLGTGAAFADSTVIRVTGIPDENPTELQRKYQPMVDYLEKKLGSKVQYVPVTDYGAAVAALAAGKVDFAWLGGFTHVQARVLTGAEPVVMRDIDREFKSVFIANIKSGIRGPKDLNGKSFAFGSKSSTSGHLMPRYFLQSQFNISPEKDFGGKPLFSGAHDATAKMVESGKVMAGALNLEVWKRLVNDNIVDTNKVKAVWTTPGYVDYVWTARKGVSEPTIARFKSAFLDLNAANAEHQAILALQGAKKFVSASASDFDAIERVGRETGLLK
jgi:phosphonate transport system substrate-binding protein